MKALTDYFLKSYDIQPASISTKARHLYHVNLMFLAFYSALVPLNLLTGDYLTALLMPVCVAITLLSLFLLRAGRHIGAAHLSILVCFSIIALDLFVSNEAPGHNVLYRGAFTYMAFMIVVTLISADRFISVKIAVASVAVLCAVFFFRMMPVQPVVSPMDRAVLINILMLFTVAAVMTMIIQKDTSLVVAVLEREKSAVEDRSHGLEEVIQERTSDLQLTMKRLEDSEARYRSIVENSHDAIVIIDDMFNIVFANRELYRITGYQRGDAAGRGFLPFIAEESRGEIAERYRKRIRGEPVDSVYELSLVTNFGTRVHCEARVSPTIDPSGGNRFIVMLMDISERKRSERSLKIQHDLAMALSAAESRDGALELIMDAVLEVDGADCGGIYLMNAGRDAMDLAVNRGLSPGFVAAASHLERDMPQMKILRGDRPSYINYAEIMKKMDSEEAEKRVQENLLALAVVPIRHQNEIVAALNCGSHTMAEFDGRSKELIESIAAQVGAVLARLMAEEAVRDSERKYRQLVEKGNNIIFTADAAGVITYISPSIKELMGFDAEEITGRPFADYIYHEDLEYIASKFRELERGILSPDEYRVIAKDGGYRWIISNSQPLVKNGEFQGIIGVFTDISWKKRAEEERLEMERRLLHAQKLESLGVLAGGIAHDFNNLLMAIMGNLELASMHLKDASPEHKLVGEAGKASQRAADLVRQMLAYSGSGSFIAREINISEMVDEIAHLLKTSISRKASLVMQLQRPVGSIFADPAQVQQIVMNLIVNSSEALQDAAGTIHIATGEIFCDEDYLSASYLEEKPAPGRYVFLEVEDTGCGMDQAVLDKLFDPFFTTKFTGRGLGMAAVLGIVRSHGGAIIVRSRPGEGTTIRVLFPVSDRGAASVEDALPARTAAGKMSGTILFVDDDDMIRSTATTMLVRLGFSVVSAGDGAQAVDLFRERPDEIALAVVDYIMPGMNGREVVSRMREIRPGARIILTSGYPRDDVMKIPGGAHPDGFIQKPYKMQELEDEIRRVLAGGTNGG
ncbi:MAG TPA: PAS domain S-box protein [Spirochaetota bacterium]|nr:PAS domain S-box protein [Spirochaetota bacterium]